MEHKTDGAIVLIAKKMARNEQRGYTAAHDDTHTMGELAMAAVAYAAAASRETIYRWEPSFQEQRFIQPWPFPDTPPPKSSISDAVEALDNLINAGALIAAEIERFQRVYTTSTQTLLERWKEKEPELS